MKAIVYYAQLRIKPKSLPQHKRAKFPSMARMLHYLYFSTNRRALSNQYFANHFAKYGVFIVFTAFIAERLFPTKNMTFATLSAVF
jgi:hypothetical protein